jgi:hypothetical protein
MLVGGLFFGATFADASANYSSVVFANSPTDYWRLNEAPHSIIAVDWSSNHNNGIYAPCVKLGVTGPIHNDPDTAGVFGKQAGCWMTYLPSSSYAGSYSVEAWVKPTSTSKKYETFFDTRAHDGTGDGSFDMKLTGTSNPGGQGVQIDVGDGYEWLSNAELPLAFTAGHWYYIAATVDASSNVADVYVNGSLLGRAPLQNYGYLPLLFDPNHPIAVGGNPLYDLSGPYLGAESFDGSIGQVAVYEHALTSTDISTHYHAGRGA